MDTVDHVVPELITKGRYIRPTLGIEIDKQLNQTLLKQLGVEGVLVLRATPGSVAEAAGLRETRNRRSDRIIPGDVILKFGGRAITSVETLLARLDDFQVGDKTTLTLWRNGDIQTIEIVL